MENKLYVAEEEREKCRKVVEAFAELYERADIVMVDVGKYGFVKLQYFIPSFGFNVMESYIDSQSLFNSLWNDWLFDKLLTPVLGTPAAELELEELFKLLPKERQDEIKAKKAYFQEKSGEAPHQG